MHSATVACQLATWGSAGVLATFGKLTWAAVRTVYAADGVSYLACAFAHRFLGPPPLYAPGDKILTPDAGFETYLPLLYRVRDSIPPLEAAVTDGDWAAVARGADAKASEAAIIANTASILGDEAYTALGLKAQFEAAAKALAKAATKQEAAAARGAVGDLKASVGEVLALIPAEVVQEVVKRERKLAELRAAEEAAAAAKRRAAEEAAAPAPATDVSAAS